MAETTMTTGTVCWLELGTSDLAGAKKFYGEVFGWRFHDNDMGGGMVYSMFPSTDHGTGGAYELMPDMKAMGVPPHWLAYFLVSDVDARAAKAKALGGKILKEPGDVPGMGRFVVIQDPIGAAFALWQPANPGSATYPTGPGAFGWAQLNASDTAKATAFYKALLGWNAKEDPMPGSKDTYTTWMAGEQMAGGMMAMPPGGGAPSHWLTYFNVNDVDASAAKVVKLGGKTFVPPTDVPGMLRFAVFADPQGAMFAVMKTMTPA